MLNLKSLLVKFIPGFIPLILFVIAEAIFGIEPALYIAITFGIGQYLFLYLKYKKNDFYVLADTLLLVLLGVVSILLNEAVLFKLKPALIELLFALLLGLSAFTRFDILSGLSKKYLKEINLTEAQLREFKRNLRYLFYIFLIHIALIVFSAYHLSEAAWAFISGALLYIMVGMLLLGQFIKYRVIKHNMRHEEWLPIVDAKGGVKGKATRTQCHSREKIMHPVVHLHVINGNSIYLQKRPMNKLIQPGKWDTAVGGHLSFGEDVEQGLRREAFEEIGIKEFEPRFLLKYVWETSIESELVYCFIATNVNDIKINRSEVDDGKFWPVSQIRENIGKGVFTPNFEKEFEFLDCIYFGGV
jgi:isopentenyldiphosphate isomerase/intracellular septation protein A